MDTILHTVTNTHYSWHKTIMPAICIFVFPKKNVIILGSHLVAFQITFVMVTERLSVLHSLLGQLYDIR